MAQLQQQMLALERKERKVSPLWASKVVLPVNVSQAMRQTVADAEADVVAARDQLRQCQSRRSYDAAQPCLQEEQADHTDLLITLTLTLTLAR